MDYPRLTDSEFEHLTEAVNAEHNPVEYLAVDPGKGNGICGYDTKFYLQFMMTIHEADIVRFMEQFEKVKVCILEGYKLYPNKTKEQIYSDMLTPRVIGRIETWAERHKVKIVLQGANVKATGYQWLGKKPLPKSNPQNHPMDAHAHGTYYAVRKGLINPADLLRKK